MKIWRIEATYRCLKCKIEREQQTYPTSLDNKIDDIGKIDLENNCPWCYKPMEKLKIVCYMMRPRV